MAKAIAASSAESGARARRARGAEDRSSMAIERRTSQRDLTVADLEKSSPEKRRSVRLDGKDFGGLRFRARVDLALEAKQYCFFTSMIEPWLSHYLTMT
jgi:hypothetical protein